MQVTASEFRNNISKYLALLGTQEIYITQNGKLVAKVSDCNDDRVQIAQSLFGIINDDGVSLSQLREERLERHELNTRY